MFIIKTLPRIFYHNILRSDLPKLFSIAIIKLVAKGKGTIYRWTTVQDSVGHSYVLYIHRYIHTYIHSCIHNIYIYTKKLHSYMHSHTSILQKNASDKETLISQTHLSSRTFTPLQLNPPATSKI